MKEIMAKKYVVTGEVGSYGAQYKFFIFGDSEEVGDYVFMSNLDIYVFVGKALKTSESLQKYSTSCIVIDSRTGKGLFFDPNKKQKEEIVVELENSSKHFKLVKTTENILNFMKEIG